MFTDPVAQFRHEVHLQWDQRVGGANKDAWPLREYSLCEDFPAAPGGAKQVVREDGATCWRVAVQCERAGARRSHYWMLGNAIELSRVVLHDDKMP